jgi:2-methylcitrate dehydratase PrpD
MLHLRATHGLTVKDAATIESWTHPRRLAHTNRPDPKSGLDGKFSIQYVLARALMHGLVRLQDFSDDAVQDRSARALMAKVHSAADPAAAPETTEHFYARVRVTTTSGAAFEHVVDRPLGRDRDHPLPSGTLLAKFRDCAQIVIDERTTDTMARLCADFENLADVAEITRAMLQGVTAQPAAVSARRYA